MKNSVRTELMVWLFSKRIWLLLGSLVFVFTLTLVGAFRMFSFQNAFFLMEEENSKENNYYEEFLLALEGSSNTSYNSEIMVADLKQAEASLHAISPEHSLSYCMETGYFFFPILLTLFGALSVKSDMNSNLMRYRIAREGRWKYYCSKQMASLAVVFICILSGIVIDFSISSIITGTIRNKPLFPLIDTTGSQYQNLGNNFWGIMFFLFFIFLFYEVGFCLGIITKSCLIPCGIVIFAFYIIPLYKYSPLNALANVFSKFCDYQGIVRFNVVEISLFSCILELSLLLLVPVALSAVIYKYRGAYK